jgi:hypothetical protein
MSFSEEDSLCLSLASPPARGVMPTDFEDMIAADKMISPSTSSSQRRLITDLRNDGFVSHFHERYHSVLISSLFLPRKPRVDASEGHAHF